MEKLTVNKADAVKYYKAANKDTKEVLIELFGADTFKFNWREVTSYEKACEVLGIQPINYKATGDRPEYMEMANAMQQLLVICEAINSDTGGWYDKDGWGYYPVFVLYSKQEMDELGEAECQRKGIHQLLAAGRATVAELAGVRCADTYNRGAYTSAHFGFPLCLNSDEKAVFVGKQFFELCCACYGVTPKMD